MIEKIGGYRRYNCKKCREGNHWVWSWHCIKTPKIGRKYRDVYERGSIEGKDRYWVSLSESLNVDDPKPDCHKCGYGIAFCEPHWEITVEHYGNTAYNSNFYHPWCYKQ